MEEQTTLFGSKKKRIIALVVGLLVACWAMYPKNDYRADKIIDYVQRAHTKVASGKALEGYCRTILSEFEPRGMVKELGFECECLSIKRPVEHVECHFSIDDDLMDAMEQKVGAFAPMMSYDGETWKGNLPTINSVEAGGFARPGALIPQ